MKSQVKANYQFIVSDNGQSNTIGYIYFDRFTDSNILHYKYSNGTSIQNIYFADFFLDLDNQWIHIIVICDYSNKTIKSYRNGAQFGATQNLTLVPQFPSIDRVKYVGSSSTSANKLTDGSLDEVRIYNRGLSVEEVMARYNKTMGRYQ